MRTIMRLALSENKKNSTRSLLIMLSVFFTTVLLSALAIFAYGQLRYQKVNAKVLYGSYYGSYLGVSKEQISQMQKRSEFDRIGLAASVGEAESESEISLIWMDEESMSLANIKRGLQEGAFPKGENDMALSQEMLSHLGYSKAKIGDRISLLFRRNNSETYQEREFVISGIMKEGGIFSENQTYTAYVSSAFYEQIYEPAQKVYNVYFTLSDSVKVNAGDLEKNIKDFAEKCGINPESALANSDYAMWALDPGGELIAGCLMAALLVLFFSLLVIYNIFQVGLAQKVREYGKIRSLGATKKQMRKLVFWEGMLPSIPGILAGLFVGSAISVFFMNLWLSKDAVFGGEDAVSVNMLSLPLLCLCAFVTLMTVRLALKIPMKMISSISPMEAIRFQGEDRKRCGKRRGKKAVTIGELTKAHMSMNKKRTLVTVLSMGLSCVLFVVIANFTGNISTAYNARKEVPYGQFQIQLTYSKDDKAYPENNLDEILKNNPLDQDLVEDIKKISKVTDIELGYMAYVRDSKGSLESVGILNRRQFEDKAYQGSLRGEVDYNLASERGQILYGWSHFIEESGYGLGDLVRLTMGSGSQEITFEGSMAGAFGSMNYDWAITDKTYDKMGFSQKPIAAVWVDCKEEDCKEVRKGLERLLAARHHYKITTYQGALKTSEDSLGIFETLSYGFLFFVGLIAFMNMANTITISIVTRKREIAVMQAMGMTKSQLHQMLRNEGLFMTLTSILLSLLIGMPMGYALFCYGRENGYFGLDIYHIPLLEIIIMVFVLSLLQLSLSYILIGNVKKESVIERIRYRG